MIDNKPLPAVAASPEPCEYVEFGGDTVLPAYTGHFDEDSTIHDPATCWWCLNPKPRKALERSGMEFSEVHRD